MIYSTWMLTTAWGFVRTIDTRRRDGFFFYCDGAEMSGKKSFAVIPNKAMIVLVDEG